MSIIIQAEELHQLLSDNNAHQDRVIFDCRFSLADFKLGRQHYEQAHIPGAQHLDMELHLSGDKMPHGGRHPLPDPDQFSKTMRAMGVNKATQVVAYDDNRLAGAARLWWLLQYFGHHSVRILDGGFQAWKEQGYQTTQQHPEKTRGNFKASPCNDQTRDYAWLKAHLKDESLQLIDSRESARFQGIEEPIDPVAGHIPGALNYPWQGVTDDEGFVLPEKLQQQRWQSLDSDKQTLVYCGSGITASVNLLSLKIAGIDNARLYPGSWSDWCSYPESPKIP